MFANKSHAEAYQFQLKKQFKEAIDMYNQALSADYKKALAIDPRDTIAINNAPQLLQKSTVPLVNPAVIRAKILSSYLEFQKRFPSSEEQKKFLHFLKNGAQNK
jgi:hypothetical protein